MKQAYKGDRLVNETKSETNVQSLPSCEYNKTKSKRNIQSSQSCKLNQT